MRKGYLVNVLLLLVFLGACTALLGRMLRLQGTELEAGNGWITHSYAVIREAEGVPVLLEGMLASERGYLLTKQDIFLSEYRGYKATFAAALKALLVLTQDNPEQQARFQRMNDNFQVFTGRLENRAEKYNGKFFPLEKDFNDTFKAVGSIKAAIIRADRDALDYERTLLRARIGAIEERKQQYSRLIFFGGAGTALLIFLFNAVLLYSQSRRASAEDSLKKSDERFTLAIEGTNDGIFDWNVRTGEVFYSRQFFTMLGYDRAAGTGTIDEFRRLLYPEDEARVWQHLDSYLRRELADFSTTFRMWHEEGRTVWIQSRAKAVFDDKGRPVRVVGANADISMLKQHQENLREEKDSAEKASRAKSDFLAHVSHEIRTPLTAISGIAEIFQRRQDNLDARQKQLVKSLYTSTATLKDLVCDILDFSKIESGAMTLSEAPFSLAETFDQIVSIMSVNTREKGLSFAFDAKGVEEDTFYGDSTRLRQILINLIGNAVKFTEKGGVRVRAETASRRGRKYLEIAVADTGIGIAPENQAVIFERFKQADSSVSRRHQGSGLGLAISKNLALLMGGSIRLESEPGRGSVFTLILPVRRAAGKQEEAGDAVQISRKVGDQIKAELRGESRILIVDDYEGNIVVLGYILEEAGYAHDVARNGLEALALWKKRHYDAILMDVQMPEMDGFTATAAIRAGEKEKGLSRTPIIGMTAHALVGDAGKCIEAGMDAYLPKPIVEADLKACIVRQVKKKKSAA